MGGLIEICSTQASSGIRVKNCNWISACTADLIHFIESFVILVAALGNVSKAKFR